MRINLVAYATRKVCINVYHADTRKYAPNCTPDGIHDGLGIWGKHQQTAQISGPRIFYYTAVPHDSAKLADESNRRLCPHDTTIKEFAFV